MTTFSLSLNPLVEVSTENIESKLSEPVGDSLLDSIREQTFLSLSDKSTPDLSSGIRRAVQLLYSSGKGYILTHIFSFSPEWIKETYLYDTDIEGKSLSSILEENSIAYSRLYVEYKKRYVTLSYCKPEYLDLADISDCTPQGALPIIKLLILIIVSTKIEE